MDTIYGLQSDEQFSFAASTIHDGNVTAGMDLETSNRYGYIYPDRKNIGIAFALTFGAGLSTALGASIVFFPSLVKLTSRRILAGSLGFSAGIMIYISFLHILPLSITTFQLCTNTTSQKAYLYASLSFFFGVFFMYLVGLIVQYTLQRRNRRQQLASEQQLQQQLQRSDHDEYDVSTTSSNQDLGSNEILNNNNAMTSDFDLVEGLTSSFLPSSFHLTSSHRHSQLLQRDAEDAEDDNDNSHLNTSASQPAICCSYNPNHDCLDTPTWMMHTDSTDNNSISIQDGNQLEEEIVQLKTEERRQQPQQEQPPHQEQKQQDEQLHLEKQQQQQQQQQHEKQPSRRQLNEDLENPFAHHTHDDHHDGGKSANITLDIENNNHNKNNNDNRNNKSSSRTSRSLPQDEKNRMIELSLDMAVAIAMHNFPEGLSTFVATLSNPTVGVMLAVAIAIHNIPEGLCIAVPMYYGTGSRKTPFIWALFSGMTEPLAGVLGYFIVIKIFSNALYGCLLGIVAGMMIMICVKELIPTAHKYDPNDTIVSKSMIVGMVVMSTSLVLYQYGTD